MSTDKRLATLQRLADAQARFRLSRSLAAAAVDLRNLRRAAADSPEVRDALDTFLRALSRIAAPIRPMRRSLRALKGKRNGGRPERFTLEQLEVAALKSKSIRGVANRLGVNHSAVAKRLEKLDTTETKCPPGIARLLQRQQPGGSKRDEMAKESSPE